ncbi:MAG: sporulation protein YunB [Bacilli bacterium]|nr:sporulation protein YunB [Bacilli bacterium]
MKKVIIIVISILLVFLMFIKVVDTYYSETTRKYIYNETKNLVSNNINSLISKSISPYLEEELVYINYQDKVVSNVIINTPLYNKILKNIHNELNKIFDNNINNYFNDLNIPIGSLISKNLFAGRGMNIKIPVIPIGSYSADLKTKSKSIGINTSVIEVVVEVIFNIETIVPLNKQTNTIQNEFLLSSIVIQGEVPNYYYASDSNESFPYVPS